MHIASLRSPGQDLPALIDPQRGTIALADVMTDPPPDVLSLLDSGVYDRAVEAARSAEPSVVRQPAPGDFGPPLRSPRKIWGIGLNYVEHAGDLSAPLPEGPASFIKADHTIIGPGEHIELPRQSERVTAEAELGLVIGRLCRDVSEAAALDYVWGVCCILDQTAEDILQRNPRFLTRSKNFPTFFSFGPTIMPMVDVITAFGSLDSVEVSTVINGTVHRANTVANMTYSPEFLVSFHSEVMPLFPGDILSTGTPGAVVVQDGDVVECRIPGVGTLLNPVRSR
jgi:2-keto-4-pentenoate hydratase/2-oxohepta-3-ene-1,7-dioic acid hydratase in catechol pathway